MTMTMDAKEQDRIVATARMAQALEDAEKSLDNAMIQAGLAGLTGIVDEVCRWKKELAKMRYSTFTSFLPPLEGTNAGWCFEEKQKEEEEP